AASVSPEANSLDLPPREVAAIAGVEARSLPRCSLPSARSVPDVSFSQFIGHLLSASRPNDRDLVRRSWHSIQRERRGKRLLLDIARSEDRDLMWADGETRNFVLWQLPARTHRSHPPKTPRSINLLRPPLPKPNPRT